VGEKGNGLGDGLSDILAKEDAPAAGKTLGELGKPGGLSKLGVIDELGAAGTGGIDKGSIDKGGIDKLGADKLSGLGGLGGDKLPDSGR
jgi:hypothetical protein